MKTMLIEEAVEYCKDKLVALHIPTQRIYNEAKKYAKEKSMKNKMLEDAPDRDDARLYFRNNGFNYNLLTEENIDILINMINRTCREFKETLALDILPTARLKKINKREKQKMFKDSHYSVCFIVIDGDYFKDRECISFNHDGFIGFAGWASDTNVFPIIRAFVTWCDFLNL